MNENEIETISYIKFKIEIKYCCNYCKDVEYNINQLEFSGSDKELICPSCLCSSFKIKYKSNI